MISSIETTEENKHWLQRKNTPPDVLPHIMINDLNGAKRKCQANPAMNRAGIIKKGQSITRDNHLTPFNRVVVNE